MVVPTEMAHHRAMLKRHLLLAVAVAAGCIPTVASLAGPTATASAASWNHRWDFLRFPAPRPYKKCVTRRITFAPGRYRWRLFEAHWAHQDRPDQTTSSVRLLRGPHRWTDCLDHFERISGPPRFVYRHRSYLDNTAHPGGPVRRVSWGLQFLGKEFGIGSYHWGSTLTHLVRRQR
jgi:hypothetical protein